MSTPAPARKHGWWRRSRHSIGWRIVALFLVLALAMAVTFVAGMQRALSGGWSGLVRPLVGDYVDHLVAEIGTPPDVRRAQALTQRLPITVHIDGPTVQWSSPGYDAEWHWGRVHGDDFDDDDGTGALLTRHTADGHLIHFGLGPRDWQRGPRYIGWVTLGLLLLLTGGAYAYVRHLLRPLRDIGAGALRFGRGDFARPIVVRRHDELGDLAAQVNAMATGLRGMLDAKRELLLAISHELRSPLTRARLNAELVPDSEDTRVARDALLRDLAEMRDLIESLLESERLAGGHAALQREPTDLNALVQDVVEATRNGRPLRIDLDTSLPPLSLDRMRLRLLLRNMLDNALRHGAGASEAPRMQTRVEGDEVVISVRDCGPGVPEDKLGQLAQPFYRADPARQRASGGVGLGLYLCQLVVRAHDGRMTFRNAQPGLEIEVRLPVDAAA